MITLSATSKIPAQLQMIMFYFDSGRLIMQSVKQLPFFGKPSWKLQPRLSDTNRPLIVANAPESSRLTKILALKITADYPTVDDYRSPFVS